ncbi:SIMPL domain-containing protein [Agromyces allii]|uniref:SIMPL domain-containing protein n=1 Tax=Agromyces allii TaxID=393607 RepID=A0ABN2QE85_9MICO|nr:SIMPL domain-containing protein [Agromyces allii]
MPTTIAVTGRAEERIAPELAAVTLSVGGSGESRDHVLSRTRSAHERLLTAVRGLEASGALESWSAPQLRVWSQRPWNAEGRQLPLVHEARADVEVVFRDLDRLGEWLGDAAGSDELTIGGVEWRLTDATRRSAQEAAQRGAVADAVAKAGVYASALGLGTPTVVELSDHGLLGSQPSPMPKAMMMRAVADQGGGSSTEFAPLDLVIEASVDARFTAEIG